MGEGVEDAAKGNSKEEVVEVMDTPERSKNTQIAASISKFEDSPVFNFLNSLSPIKPVKSIHITQTINPLSFASIPSVFTSPHIASLKESRFLRRHQLPDPSKPEFSSDEGTAAHDANKVNMVCSTQLGEHQENVNPRESDSELAAEQSYDCSKFVVDFPEDSDCNSPDPTSRPSCGLKGKELADYASNSSALVPVAQNGSHVDPNKEGTSCGWENLICEDSDLLIFESPDVPNLHTLCVVGPTEGCDQESLSTQPGEGNEMIDNAQAHDDPGEKSDYENLPGFYRGMRRRCLVFEMGGARRKHLDENSGSTDTSPLLILSEVGGSSTNDQKLVPTIKAGNESSRCVLPGIGLHLNALAATPKDYKIVTHDSSAPGRLLIGPSSSVNFHSSDTNQEMLNSILPEREIDSVEDAIMPMEDTSQASGFMSNEEINPSSPKKKRRKADLPEEAGSCKRCNCKKSKCLKLYCECFAAGVYCVEPCACIDCFNKPVHEDTVLATRKQIESRNPLAFAPKVIRGADPVSEIGDDSSKTPASARHKRGCNCKKSGCLKKYCECYQGGVGCSINCRCEGCKNAFGRKDGTEVETEEDETETNEKSTVEQNMDSAPPATPIRSTRQSGQLPFSSKRKPPRSSFPSIGSSSSGFYTNQGGFAKPSFFQPPPPPKFDQHFETVREDEEMPEFLQGESSPIGGIKMSSPNRKRVSPPHNVGVPPGLRSSRKLILQSIPSFPSLTSNQ